MDKIDKEVEKQLQESQKPYFLRKVRTIRIEENEQIISYQNKKFYKRSRAILIYKAIQNIF